MEFIQRFLTVVLVVIFSLSLSTGTVHAFSGSSGEGKQGDPPFGLAISSDAQGAQLSGVLVIEYFNWRTESGPSSATDFADRASVILRLRKGKMIEIFYDDVPGPLSPNSEPLQTQQIIMDRMMPQVLEFFFPGEDVKAKVKSLKQFTWIFGSAFLPRFDIMPGYGTCQENVLACDPNSDAWCDPNDPTLYITTCQGNYEFCNNGIDDDGDLKVDLANPLIADPDCLNSNGYVVTDINISVK